MNLSEIDALIAGTKPLPPERIFGWMDTQMSIARFYGGLTYQGHKYTIALNEQGMPLVRDDVLVRESKEQKDRLKAARKADQQAIARKQGVLL